MSVGPYRALRAMTTVADMGELALLIELRRRFLRPPDPRFLVGNGDDAAVIVPTGPVALTVDSVVAGVDWLPGVTPPEAVGHRAAAVNLSDLAAIGARPTCLLLALELPPDADVEAILRGADGLAHLADRFGAEVIGGDLGLSPGPQRWTVTAVGELPGQPLRRDAAVARDVVWLVGEVGLASLGLQWLQHAAHAVVPDWARAAVHAHLWPEPMVAAGLLLGTAGVRVAALDVSDGLSVDAARMARQSGVALALDVARPPWLSEAAASGWRGLGADWRVACAAGGDDYALLVAAPPELDVAALLAPCGVAVQIIGRVLSGPAGHVDLRVAGEPMAAPGWLHGSGES